MLGARRLEAGVARAATGGGSGALAGPRACSAGSGDEVAGVGAGFDGDATRCCGGVRGGWGGA